MPDPEALAREDIDRQLELAGWLVQDRDKMDLFAAPGVVIRKVAIPSDGDFGCFLIASQRLRQVVELK